MAIDSARELRHRGDGVMEGLAPHQPTRGSGECRKLPQRGPGQSLSCQGCLVHFDLKEGHWWCSKNDILATFYFLIFVFDSIKRLCDA